MKPLLKLLIYPAFGLILFVLAFCVILALKGKLNAQAFATLPVVGSPAEPKPDEKAASPVQTVATMRYFSSEELSDMLKETMQLKKKLEEDAAKLAGREKRIDIVKADIQREKNDLERMREELGAKRLELRKSEAAYTESIAEISQVELAGLQRTASIYESMDSKKAAAALVLLDKTQAAKLLSLMDGKKAARLLGEMPPSAAAEMITTLKQVKANVENKND